ncbi:PTPRJ phosphatase, partial [Burhinus bistriatus]|nr:PTPRJ phosphatase [Burhinus bistriatus]
FTEPSPVHDLKKEYVGVTSVNLTWAVSDAASDSYTYRIEVVNGTSVRNLTSNVTCVEITELIPGTMYNFTVFAAVNDSQTEGEGLSICLYTKPSPVHDLREEYVGVTSVNLTWAVSDAASDSYTYRIEVVNGASVRNLTSNVTGVEITELIPGTMYNFTVFAAVNGSQTEGEGLSICLYTKPSPVHDVKAQYVGVTSVNLTWAVSDAASDSYTYRIEVVNGTCVRNLTSNVTGIEIAELIPGTMYNFTVFAAVNGSQTEGEGLFICLYTKPSPVHDLKKEYVGVTSVNLTWAVSDAASDSYTYRIEVVNGASVRNLTSNVTGIEITELIPGTMYNFTVFAAVNGSQTEGEGLSICLYT